MITRREFVLSGCTASVAGAALGFRPLAAMSEHALAAAPARKPLRILILGGTGLTGPHQVRYAVGRGHKVTVFNRGRHNERLPNGVEELQGDRQLHQVQPLKGREWDVVIDNPTSLPFWIKDVGEIL